MMLKPGDIVMADFPGVTGVKRRPVVVISTNEYHTHRPDVIVSIITSQIQGAVTPVDYVLQDWAAGGLNHPSAFRTFIATLPAASIGNLIGKCSERDWQGIQARLVKAIATQ